MNDNKHGNNPSEKPSQHKPGEVDGDKQRQKQNQNR